MLVGARLNWLLSHGKGKTWGEPRRRSSSRSTSSRRRWTRTSRSPRRSSATSAPASRRCSRAWATSGRPRRPIGRTPSTSKREENVAKMAPRLMNNRSPMDFHGALGALAHRHQGAAGRDPRQRGRQHARSRPRHHRHVPAAQAPRRRHLGRHGHRHGLRHRRGDRDRQAGARGRGRQRLRLLGHGDRDDLPLQPAGLRRRSSTTTASIAAPTSNPAGSDPATTVFVKARATTR